MSQPRDAKLDLMFQVTTCKQYPNFWKDLLDHAVLQALNVHY